MTKTPDDRTLVVLVSYPDDEHGTAIENGLSAMGTPYRRVSLDALERDAFEWSIGKPVLIGDETLGGAGRWTGLWRRPGQPSVSEIDPRYADFVASEARDAFRGALLAAPIRWLNDPVAMWRAEHKIVQLECARSERLMLPETVVTNDPRVAKDFIGRVGPAVAKAVRYGLVAAAPQPTMAWTTRVDPDDAFEFHGIPVMLQAEVRAQDHLRVITVQDRVFVARCQSRALDWRADIDKDDWDRVAVRKVPADVANGALRIARRLDLGYSSQDWVVAKDGRLVFLEANPNGQWLFADEAHQGAITRTICTWLATGRTTRNA